MIEQVAKLIEEYGWSYKVFDGEESGHKFVLTYVNPDFDRSLKIVILFQQKDQWLYVSTHKFLKFNFQRDNELIIRFLKFNSQIPLVKWFTREVKEEVFINIGFEIHKDDFSKESLFKNLDIMTFYLDDTVSMLKEMNKISEESFTKINEVTKESFELS